MTEIGRRAIVSIIGAGAFVFFDESLGSGTTSSLLGGAGGTTTSDVVLENGTVSLTPLNDGSGDVDVTVSGELVNYGGSSATQQVNFRDQVEDLGAKTVDVAGEGSSSVSFTATYLDVTESDITLDVLNGESSSTFVLDLPRPDIQIDGLTIEDGSGTQISEVEENTTFYVNGTAGNFGQRFGEKLFELYGDGTAIDQTTVGVNAGGNTAVSLSHSYDFGLSSGQSQTVSLAVNDTTVGDLSVIPAPAIPDGAIDDFESADLVVENEDWSDWSKIQGDSLSAQQSVVLEGSYSGELAANSADTRWQTTRSSEAQRSDFRYDFQISEQNGDSGDFHLFRLFGSGSDFVQFFSRQDGSIDINANTGVASWSADTRYRLNLSNIDYSNENLDVEILDVDASSSLYSATDVSFNESASGLDEVVVGHKNSNSGTTGSTFIDLVGWPPE